jgi:hypothetical protein
MTREEDLFAANVHRATSRAYDRDRALTRTHSHADCPAGVVKVTHASGGSRAGWEPDGVLGSSRGHINNVQDS